MNWFWQSQNRSDVTTEIDNHVEQPIIKKKQRNVVYLVEKGNPIRKIRKVYTLGEAGWGIPVNEKEDDQYYIIIPGRTGGKIKDSNTLRWEKEYDITGLTDVDVETDGGKNGREKGNIS